MQDKHPKKPAQTAIVRIGSITPDGMVQIKPSEGNAAEVLARAARTGERVRLVLLES